MERVRTLDCCRLAPLTGLPSWGSHIGGAVQFLMPCATRAREPSILHGAYSQGWKNREGVAWKN